MGGAGSGRVPMEFDADALIDMLEHGHRKSDIAKELGMSQPTLQNKIAQLQKMSPIMLEYRSLQTLELTELQSKILNNITDEKIEQAPLRDLVLAYKILKEKEFMVEGKPQEVKGLVHYLLEVEKLEQAERMGGGVGVAPNPSLHANPLHENPLGLPPIPSFDYADEVEKEKVERFMKLADDELDCGIKLSDIPD